MDRSIPELLSHISMHIQDQEVLGLEATKKCLKQYPGNKALQQNRKFFENRLSKSRKMEHVSLSLPSAYYSSLCFTNNTEYSLSTIHFSILLNGIQIT